MYSNSQREKKNKLSISNIYGMNIRISHSKVESLEGRGGHLNNEKEGERQRKGERKIDFGDVK